MNYHFIGEENIDSPSLIYYENILRENLEKIIELAGGADRLWPHMKSHKMAQMLKMQMDKGITRFKCATIAEAELCAIEGAEHVIIAYPLVGPAIGRFTELRKLYTKTIFWAAGDNLNQPELLGKIAGKKNENPINTLLDVNFGMNRTGISLDILKEFFLEANRIPGLKIMGFHCYDGHLGINDINKRKEAVLSVMEKFNLIKQELAAQGHEGFIVIMGGTPTFPCYIETKGVYLSPGTLFINDYGYASKFSDLDFTPGAAILSRVISHPDKNLFTLDTGHKAIASEQIERGIIVDFPNAKSVSHSEEHWVWQLDEENLPQIGTIVYIIPAHICPTSALYPDVLIVKDGKLVDYWEVAARNRKINI
jgi:D-serine deaminase-like pyridoxal phosphate-dependent protein